MSDWLENLHAAAGTHPRAAEAAIPVSAKPRRAEREGSGSLDLGAFEIALVDDRAEGDSLVETPLRADGLGDGKKRIHIRLSEDLERFVYANTRGSINGVIAALLVYGFQELQSSGKKLCLRPTGETEPTDTQE